MHSVTFVLLRPPIVDVRAAINALLAPYRLNEDQYDPSWRVTPDGVWHGLFDFGWKFRERDAQTT